MIVSDDIAYFLEAIQAERSAAPNTCLAYGRDLKDFSSFMGDKPIARASRKDVLAYLKFLQLRGKSDTTRMRRLAAIRQFFLFCHEEGWRQDVPTLDVPYPARPRRLPKDLSVERTLAMLKAVRGVGRSDSARKRNTCILELLYASGMRVSELVGLPRSSVAGNPEMLLVLGKGGKERLVPLTTPARLAIKEWLRELEAADDKGKGRGARSAHFLFPSSGKQGHLSRVAVFRLIKKTALACGIDPKGVSPHTFRHAFATHLLANGADLNAIRHLLGHADISTTEIYTHMIDDKLKSTVFSNHPLARQKFSPEPGASH